MCFFVVVIIYLFIVISLKNALTAYMYSGHSVVAPVTYIPFSNKNNVAFVCILTAQEVVVLSVKAFKAKYLV